VGPCGHDVGYRWQAGRVEARMVGKQAAMELNGQYGPRLMWLKPETPDTSQNVSLSE